ncbi:hypothetical protein Ancab_028845 [Ancistrocladus abbreviatus]
MAETTIAMRAATGGGAFRIIGGGRDLSLDSVILTPDQSNFSLFSYSTSASADCFYFACDALDHDSLLSHFSQKIFETEELEMAEFGRTCSRKRL